MHADEGHLLQAARDGDHEAFQELVRRHQGPLFGVLVRLVGDAAVADELAQEAFVRAYRSLAGFREESGFGTWLIQIGIHAARDHRRRSSRRANVVSLEQMREAGRRDSDPADPRPGADPSLALEGREAGRIIGEALLRLPEAYREVLALKHFQGWSYESIAASTGDSVGTLKVRAHRARKLLREEMEALGWDAGEEPRRTAELEVHRGRAR